MSDPRSDALARAAVAYGLLMDTVGTETHPVEDPDRVQLLRTAVETAVEESRAAATQCGQGCAVCGAQCMLPAGHPGGRHRCQAHFTDGL